MGKFTDLTGKIFGRLTVKNLSEKRINNRLTWNCQCVCGNYILVNTDKLKNGNTKSCGCLAKEIRIENGKATKKYNTYDLSGQFGIGYTSKGDEFYFDLEDYDKIKNYCWNIGNGYVITTNNNKTISFHRLVMNTPKNKDTDHINHNTIDNRKENLRIVNRSQNNMNSVLKSNNSSGFKGVYWSNRDEKWVSKIQLYNKYINLGYFENINEAIEIRKDAELEYFKEYRYKENE